MKNSSIDLSGICDQSIISCLTEIREQTKNLDMDFLVVGALVRFLILEKYYKIPTGAITLDIDIGITVPDWEHYKKLKDYLVATKYFKTDTKVYHRLMFKEKFPVDLIPFGTIEASAGLIQWPPDQAIKMNVTGFQEALKDAVLVSLSDRLDVYFASWPGMTVLKLIAWRDRHNEFPTKDAIDLAALLRNYYHLWQFWSTKIIPKI